MPRHTLPGGLVPSPDGNACSPVPPRLGLVGSWLCVEEGSPQGGWAWCPPGVGSPVTCQADSHGLVRFTSPVTQVVRFYLGGHLIVGCPPSVFLLH